MAHSNPSGQGDQPPPQRPTYIVGEITKNWVNGRPVVQTMPLLSVAFEQMLNHNRTRGYRLLQFQMYAACPSPDELIETIVAVFERVDIKVD